MIRRLWKSKVFWTALVGLVTAVGAAATGQIEWGKAIELSFGALLAMFFRDTLAKP